MKNKIVVTGASSEIGLAICKSIITENDEAILHCFQNQTGLTSYYKNRAASIKIVSADFNDIEEVDKFAGSLGDVDILINAAAITGVELLVNLTDEDIMAMISVNILAMTKICKAVIPSMVSRRRGCIVNISSVAAQRGNRGQSIYAGTKGFTESFTRALAAEYGRKGIRVNAVALGPIESGSLNELLAFAGDEVKQSVISPRLGKPEDAASMTAYLCSDQASYINGKVFSVDGGFQKGV